MLGQKPSFNTPTPKKYTLDPSSKKFVCPGCEQKRFVRFINEEGLYLEEKFGRCDREESCGYYLHPASERVYVPKAKEAPIVTKQIKYVPSEVVYRTLAHYDQNTFVQWLFSLVGELAAIDLVAAFMVGTAKNAGTIFWQVDRKGKIRTAQKLFYNSEGKRRRDVIPAVERLYKTSDGYESCLFGLHQLHSSSCRNVAIVESEKTAILCSHFFPSFQNQPILWMASCGAQGLTFEKMADLVDCKVLLFPDFSENARASFQKCAQKMNEMGIPTTVVDFLPEEKDGSDIGDWVICELLMGVEPFQSKTGQLVYNRIQDGIPVTWNEKAA